MRRTWPIWLAFGLCVATGVAVLAVLTRAAVELRTREEAAEYDAGRQERIRLALWRMDSSLSPLLTRESARPYYVYKAFAPVSRAYTNKYNAFRPDEVLAPSPLLTFTSPEVRLHFQVAPDGDLTSPQVPLGEERKLAEHDYTTAGEVARAAGLLAELGRSIRRDALAAAVPQEANVLTVGTTPNWIVLNASGQEAIDNTSNLNTAIPVVNSPAQLAQAEQQGKPGDVAMMQNGLNNTEQRARIASQGNAMNQQQYIQPQASKDPREVREGPMRPLWQDGSLLLVRGVWIDGEQFVQGCWLDWEAIRRDLLDGSRDLLPDAALEKVEAPAGLTAAAPPAPLPDAATYVLASLPVRLNPGEVPRDRPRRMAGREWSLVIAWVALLLGSAAVGMVVDRATRLSRRRGDFVSAVTHELRTPLTTFRLYSDMLAGGMITDQEKRQAYLRRLRDEADRLSHLVENVLCYARLGSPRGSGQLSVVAAGELFASARGRLEALAERGAMQLRVDLSPEAADARVLVSVSAVEQVLLNLVDNACKFAGRAAERTIELTGERRGGQVVLAVRDHGPGISPTQAKRLFRAFAKSAHQAANSAPGVGLGLEISRRLARAMRGDLRLDASCRDGARFVLTLPVAE